MKKILFAASECVPFIKTGGLADVCGALPKTFDHKDWDVRVVIPNYSCIPEKYRSQFEYVTHFYMACGSYIPSKYVGVLQYKLDGVTYYFIDNQEYFNCFVPYGDMRYDIEKFTFFDKAVLSMLPLIGFRPDIIHCHDWQAALRRTPSKSPAPKSCPVTTLKPPLMPSVKITSIIKSGAVAPTAASALTPMVRPTIIISAILYSC